jgi:TPR repeat protein
MELVCPHCGSDKVRGSSPHASDGLGKLLFAKSMRCQKCRHRFWVRSYAKPAVLAFLIVGGLGMLVGQMPGRPGGSATDGLSPQDAVYQRAKAGDAQAELEMGLRYAEGDGFIKNPKEAAIWLTRAAKHGSVEAQYRLGLALLEGRGVVQDFQAAFAWIDKAANRGYAPAQYSLGDLYRFGTGVEMDKAKAYLWFNLAAAQGVEDAAKARDSVAYQLKPDQLKAMQDEARQLSQQQAEMPEEKKINMKMTIALPDKPAQTEKASKALSTKAKAAELPH